APEMVCGPSSARRGHARAPPLPAILAAATARPGARRRVRSAAAAREPPGAGARRRFPAGNRQSGRIRWMKRVVPRACQEVRGGVVVGFAPILATAKTGYGRAVTAGPDYLAPAAELEAALGGLGPAELVLLAAQALRVGSLDYAAA